MGTTKPILAKTSNNRHDPSSAPSSLPAQLMFMRTGDRASADRTPLESLIAGDIDAVVSAAACYGEPKA
jgi:hypothetical protein